MFSDARFNKHKDGREPLVTEIVSKSETVKLICLKSLQTSTLKQILDTLDGIIEPLITYDAKSLTYSLWIFTTPLSARTAKQIGEQIITATEKRTGIKTECDIIPNHTNRISAQNHGANEIKLPMYSGELILRDGKLTDNIEGLQIPLYEFAPVVDTPVVDTPEEEVVKEDDMIPVSGAPIRDFSFNGHMVLDFAELPRSIGNPAQNIISKDREDNLYTLLNSYNGTRPCFVSHNSYPVIDRGGTIKGVHRITGTNIHQINHTKIFIDFDDKAKPENAMIDCLKLIDWCEKENIPVYPVFSGGKGFHAYILMKPEVRNANEGLSRQVESIHYWLVQKLNLRTLDLKAKDMTRLCRVPYSKYVTTDKKTGRLVSNGCFCQPISPTQMRSMNMAQVKEWSKKLHRDNYEPKGNRLTLDEFMARFDIDPDEIIIEAPTRTATITDFKPVADEELKKLFHNYPCILHQLNTANPQNEARVGFVIVLQKLGYSEEWILELWKQFRTEFKDFNEDKTRYHIKKTFAANGGEGYIMYGCSKIKSVGMCIGDDKCKQFKAEYFASLPRPTGRHLNRTSMMMPRRAQVIETNEE